MGLPLLITSRFLLGFGAGTLSAVRAYIAEVSTSEERTSFVAISSAVQFLGFAITPSLGQALSAIPTFHLGRFVTVDSLTIPGWFLFISNLLLLILIVVVFRNPAHKEVDLFETADPNGKSTWATIYADKTVFKGFIIFMLINFLIRGTLGIFETLGTPIYITMESRDTSGYFFGAMGLIGVIFLLAINWLSKHGLHDYIILMVGNLIMVAGCSVVMTQHMIFPRFVTGLVLIWGMGFPLAQTVVVSMFSKILSSSIGKSSQGTFMGLIGAAGAAGRIIGPLCSGALYTHEGTFWVFFYATGLSIVSVIASLFVTPKSLSLTPNLTSFDFEGTVEITLQVVEKTDVIVLHSAEIVIIDATVDSTNKVTDIAYDTDDDVVSLTLTQPLEVGTTAVLRINYTGILNDKLKGFYRSKFTVDGVDKWIATTQFEPTEARFAFPCFDEPALKAIFEVTMITDSHLTVISNTLEKETIVLDGKKSTRFLPTPIMSTYLLAFVVGEFKKIEGKTKEGVLVRVFSPAGMTDCGEFALSVSTRALSFFTEYFGIPFPLDKCDQIAVPDFGFGAMENWGAVIYRQGLLMTTENSTLREKQVIASIIGHELAHQWFGNLVTMNWWSDLWLNEGFATFMGDTVTDHLFPEWNTWLEFSEGYRNSALATDVLESSHPIQVPVKRSSEIQEIFDAISYNKGASVIQMLATRLGDNFRKGLHHYLTKFSYKNTNTEDLWDSLTFVSGVNVGEFMRNFTMESGFPLLSITPQSETGKYTLCQKKFRLDGGCKPTDPLWSCHIKIKTQSDCHEFCLNDQKTTITIPSADGKGWMKPNYGQTGYYRVGYDETTIASLLPLVKSLELPGVDRLGLLSDVNSLCKSGDIKVGILLDLLFAFGNEVESTILIYVNDILHNLLDIVVDQPYYPKLKSAVIALLSPIYAKHGFDACANDTPNTILIRERVNTFLGSLGHTEIVEESQKRFASGQALPNVMANGGEKEQSEIIKRYTKTSDNSEKLVYLRLIGYTHDPKLVEKALELSLNFDLCRSQDTDYIWCGTPNAMKSVVWAFFTKHFDRIFGIFEEIPLFPYIVSSTMSRCMSDQVYTETKAFLDSHPIALADRSIKQDLEVIKNNNRWFSMINNDVATWINNHIVSVVKDTRPIQDIYFVGGRATPAVYIYNISANQWRAGPPTTINRPMLNNAVSTGLSIYVFAGELTARCFETLDTLDKQVWRHGEDIETKQGGRFVSTCYDGSRYIYLLGGYDGRSQLSRLDRFDTYTDTTVSLGDPKYAIQAAYTFLANGGHTLYIMGGCRTSAHMCQILTIDLHNIEAGPNILVDNIFGTGSTTLYNVYGCFDQQEYVYMLSNQTQFVKVSIKTKEITTLSPYPESASAFYQIGQSWQSLQFSY
eukprot:gene17753-21173_t